MKTELSIFIHYLLQPFNLRGVFNQSTDGIKRKLRKAAKANKLHKTILKRISEILFFYIPIWKLIFYIEIRSKKKFLVGSIYRNKEIWKQRFFFILQPRFLRSIVIRNLFSKVLVQLFPLRISAQLICKNFL